MIQIEAKKQEETLVQYFRRLEKISSERDDILRYLTVINSIVEFKDLSDDDEVEIIFFSRYFMEKYGKETDDLRHEKWGLKDAPIFNIYLEILEKNRSKIGKNVRFKLSLLLNQLESFEISFSSEQSLKSIVVKRGDWRSKVLFHSEVESFIKNKTGVIIIKTAKNNKMYVFGFIYADDSLTEINTKVLKMQSIPLKNNKEIFTTYSEYIGGLK